MTNNTNIAEITQSPVAQVITTAPHHKEFLAAETQVRSLAAQHVEAKAEAEKLLKEYNSQGATAAQDLLDGKGIPDEATKDALHAAHRKIAIIEEAQQLQQRYLREARIAFSREVNVTLRASRQQLVSRMADALRELRAASDEDQKLRSELQSGGVELLVVDNLAFAPVSSDCAYDLGWRVSRRNEGYVL